MNEVHKRRLLLILIFISAGFAVVALVLYALNQNINLFYTPTDIKLSQTANKNIVRVGGMVVKNSIVREADGLTVHFNITDFKNTVRVDYHGILPDLFRDGQGVVVSGIIINKEQMNASEVLAKHDANYMPKELKDIARFST